MMSAILTVCRKEILDNSRDRRTVLTSILLGPLLGPLLFVVVISFTISQATSSAEEPIDVPIIGAEHAENLVAFLASRDIVASEDHGIASIEEAVNAVRNGDQEIVVLIDDSFGDDLAGEAGAHVSLVYDESDNTSGPRIGRVRGSINAYSQQIGALRLLARGLDPSVVRPLIIDNFDVSTAEERSSLLLGMLTYFLLFATLMGGLYLATDTTAGERERKSLEPLLATPVRRSSLLLGKMGATVAFMLLSLALTLACFAASIRFMPLAELGMSTSFGPGTAMIAFLVLIPFAPLGRGVDDRRGVLYEKLQGSAELPGIRDHHPDHAVDPGIDTERPAHPATHGSPEPQPAPAHHQPDPGGTHRGNHVGRISGDDVAAGGGSGVLGHPPVRTGTNTWLRCLHRSVVCVGDCFHVQHQSVHCGYLYRRTRRQHHSCYRVRAPPLALDSDTKQFAGAVLYRSALAQHRGTRRRGVAQVFLQNAAGIIRDQLAPHKPDNGDDYKGQQQAA